MSSTATENGQCVLTACLPRGQVTANLTAQLKDSLFVASINSLISENSSDASHDIAINKWEVTKTRNRILYCEHVISQRNSIIFFELKGKLEEVNKALDYCYIEGFVNYRD